MRRVADALCDVALTLWIGGLWTTGLVVAPTLFAELRGNRPLAGTLAGAIFELAAWVGLACATYLVAFLIYRWRGAALRRGSFWLILVMLLLTAVSLFGIQPLLAQLKADALPREVMESVLRDRFSAWHGISSLLYVVQSLLGLLLVTTFRGAR